MDGFVGRDRELATLERMLQRVTQGGEEADPVEADLRLFVEAALCSNLPDIAVFDEQAPQTWDAALRLLAAALPADRVTVIVLDEMPYLIATDPGFEGTLRKLFDRELSRRPVLLICIGSDLVMMAGAAPVRRPRPCSARAAPVAGSGGR